jgi:hypothetical protein
MTDLTELCEDVLFLLVMAWWWATAWFVVGLVSAL